MSPKNPLAISMLEKFDDSKRAVANLMARENITCQVVDGSDTAYFNPKTRVLTVPNWTGLTVEQCDLLMSHEIGHALFTDREIELRKISRGLFTYLNIIEDARIERRMKGAFPGLAPTFYKGYREFHANGPILKGTKDALYHPKTGALIPVATMRLIDRINLHYKIGAFVNVPFSETERVWLARIDKSSSTEECLQIAREMHKAQKEQDQKEQEQNPSNTKQKPAKSPKQEETEQSDSNDADDQESSEGESQDGDDQESDSTESDGDSTESDDQDSDDESKSGKSNDAENDEENEESSSDSADDSDDDADDQSGDDADADADEDGEPSDQSGSGNVESDPEAMTDTAEQLKGIANKDSDSRNTIVNILYPVLTDDDLKGRTITAAEFTKGAYDALAKSSAPASDLDILETAWNNQFLATAKHMALEFERRKQARQLQAATTGKSGKLDLTKLASYRFTEDLFKRTMIVPNGKSHGIVMLIDGSSSMSGQFKDVIDQTLLFAQFAFIVNIPFEAYMFSDACDWNENERGDGHFTMKSTGLNSLTLNKTGRLIGLVNTTTDRGSFKKNVRALLAVRAQYDRWDDASAKLDQRTWNGISKIPHSHLSGTPLFMGVMIAERHIARMKQTQRLDKTTFVVITDGEDTNGLYYESTKEDTSGWRNMGKFAQLEGPFVVRDAVTKKNLPYVRMTTYSGQPLAERMDNAQLTMLLDIIKLRHDTRTVYIYLQERGITQRAPRYSRYRRYRRYARPSYTAYSVEGFNYLVRAGKSEDAHKIQHETIAAQMKEDGQYVLPTNVAVADLAIILPVNSVRLTENAFAKLDTEEMTQRKIAAEFTKAMTKAVANRKFVNSVIPHLI